MSRTRHRTPRTTPPVRRSWPDCRYPGSEPWPGSSQCWRHLVVATGCVRIARDYYLQGLHELTALLGPELADRLRRAVSTEVSPDADPRHDPQVGVQAADVGEVPTTDLQGSGWDDVHDPHPNPDQIHISEKQRIHILDGNVSGGGHRPGAGPW